VHRRDVGGGTRLDAGLDTGLDTGLGRGLDALRAALMEVLTPALAVDGPGQRPVPGSRPARAWTGALLAESVVSPFPTPDRGAGDEMFAASSETDVSEGRRIVELVELARAGDAEAFGMLYDHYQPSVYRFLYYRVGSVALAEDLTSETFVRALRNMGSFRWQGKDFGAWLTTIARNLATDHAKSGRSRLEVSTDDMSLHDSSIEGPEGAVLAAMTHEALLAALRQLPTEQQDCLVLRFLQSRSIAETAAVLGRSEGAVKQLQLRAVRNLAKRLPEGFR
jgi:RNA polymerase sigma-70 factor, ECF subfamily